MVDFGDLKQRIFDQLLGIAFDLTSFNHLVQNQLAKVLLLEVDLKVVLFVSDFLLEAESNDLQQIFIEHIIIHNILVHTVCDGFGQGADGVQVGVVEVFLD